MTLVVGIGIATLLLALGLWLALPRGAAPGRALGFVLVAVSLGVLAAQLPQVGSTASSSVFYILSAVTLLSAVATITFRNPVYSAIWFALSLLGTAGLFMFQGAQFLGVATIVVYAGAILVTFLFVLMLAQPKGQSPYDRVGWAARLSALTGAVLVGVMALAVTSVFQNPVVEDRPKLTIAAEALDKDILSSQHVAHLGAQLFSRQLVAIEVAGTLLLIALVGTVAIVALIRQPERGPYHG